MKNILKEDRFSFLSDKDKEFMVRFDCEMERMGYTSGGKVGDGFCWGKYMIIYRRSGVNSKNVYARIYVRTGGIVLRLFLNKVSDHADYIATSPPHIKEAFTADFGKCNHEHDKNGVCKFRKAYTIEGRLIEKCNGMTFWFKNPELTRLGDYLELFEEFYHRKKRKR